jgi:outer membrane receptor for ferrienterochelin and colicin
MTFGGTVTQHIFRPNIIRYDGSLTLDGINKEGPRLTTYEQAAYINDDWQINKRWQLNGGIRLSALYTEKELYINPEPRIATCFLITNQHSIKLSYAHMAQYLHLVSSSAITLPTDLWYPVTAKTKPEKSDQVSIGYYYAQPERGLAASIECYYKKLHNQIEYREGANLLFNDKYEEELITGKGKAYGAEFFVSKTVGKLSGWMGYSLSLSERQFEELNQGKPFFTRFDRRHDFSLVTAYDISRRHIVAATWIYSSGSPFTPQIGQYIAPNPSNTQIDILPIYGAKNSARLSTANRIDIDYGYKFKWLGKVSSEFHISIYNLLNKAQPEKVSREYNGQTGKYEYQEKGLFGRIPTLSLNFKL